MAEGGILLLDVVVSIDVGEDPAPGISVVDKLASWSISDLRLPMSDSAPTYVEEDVLHYCVANMPGAFASTSTQALSNATERYLTTLANGPLEVFSSNEALLKGLNVHRGELTVEPVAAHFVLTFPPALEGLEAGSAS